MEERALEWSCEDNFGSQQLGEDATGTKWEEASDGCYTCYDSQDSSQ